MKKLGKKGKEEDLSKKGKVTRDKGREIKRERREKMREGKLSINIKGRSVRQLGTNVRRPMNAKIEAR